MNKVRNLFSGMLAVLAVLLLTGCGEKDNPVRTSLDVDTSTLTLSVGESAVRMASSKAEDAAITYTSSKPAVATVDQFGKVTAMSEGTATITIEMAETKKSWYAAKTITYEVVVKNVSAKAVANVDKATPLTLVAQADGKITVTFNGGITLANDIKYTINNGAEQTIAKNTSGAYDITVKKGDVVQLYSLNSSLGGSTVAGARGTTRAVDDGAKYINIRPSMKTEIYGNVMSLLKGKDNLESATTIEANNAFYGLFAGAEKLVNNTERLLVLPATTLTEGCYDNMFSGCKGIEKAPELPAPKLEKGCYQEMFFDCAKLNSVKCLASDVVASDALKDFLKGAGTAAEKAPVIETATPLPAGTVPSNFTEVKAVTDIKLNETSLDMTVSDTKPLTATLTPTDAFNKTLEWTSSNPAVATVQGDATDNTKATVTAVGAGSATITCFTPDGSVKTTCAVIVRGTYREYSYTTSLTYNDVTIPSDAKSVSATTKSWSGTYMVGGSVTINGDVECTGDVNLILLDGSRLTVNGHIYGGTSSQPDSYSLNIYAQSEGSNMGALYIDAEDNDIETRNGNNIVVKNLAIHGGKIVATNGEQALEAFGPFKIYGGDISATGSTQGITVSGGLDIYGGKLVANGGWNGINAWGCNVTVEGGNVTVASTYHPGKFSSAAALYAAEGNIIINGGTVTAIGCNGTNGGTNEDGSGINGSNGDHGVQCAGEIERRGSVTITGGTLIAKGGNGGNGGNATSVDKSGGSGGNGGNGILGAVTNEGGTLTATGGAGGTKGTGANCNDGANGADQVS